MGQKDFAVLLDQYHHLVAKKQYQLAQDLLLEYEKDHFLYQNEYQKFNQLKEEIAKKIALDNYQKQLTNMGEDELLIAMFANHTIHFDVWNQYFLKIKKNKHEPNLDYFFLKLKDKQLSNEDKLFVINYLNDLNFLNKCHELVVYDELTQKNKTINLDTFYSLNDPKSLFKQIKQEIENQSFKEPSLIQFAVAMLYSEYVANLGDISCTDIKAKAKQILEQVKDTFNTHPKN